ncbi:prepilin-type N-terminal cleavage/methylation domain-containing protein [Erwinia sp. SLM-02]|uniref:prepilin-type N-terminal cleavage/methylation domain-containing protein n=1 Tax=Erwinia sp. SLM-02 TaxID=3020057 RepID=UPI0030801686
MTRRCNQRGFSLVETLFALLLFSLSITALMRYQLVLADGFQQQWQQRSAWRNAWQLLQGNPLEGWRTQMHQRSGPQGCQLLTAQVISPAWRRAELVQLRCPAVDN